YIGISMLCCLNCHAAIEAVNQVNEAQSKSSILLKKIDNRSYDAPIIQTIISSSDSKAAIELDATSYLKLARRGNHDRSFDKWAAPHFINAAKSAYGEIYKKILTDIKNDQPLSTMYMSDTEASLSEEEVEKKVWQKELNDQALTERGMQKQLNINDTAEDKQIKKLGKFPKSAFNQFANQHYRYNETDITYIGRQIERQLEKDSIDKGLDPNKVKFIEPLGGTSNEKIAITTEVIIKYINEHINNKQSSEQKSLVGAYNVNENHWIAYTIMPKENGDAVILYKDSLGNKQDSFVKVMEAAVKHVLANVSSTQLDTLLYTNQKTGKSIKIMICGSPGLNRLVTFI
ncbi:MAG: hypothetical protein ACK4M7_09540, partial [Burkholderiales bacterium]